MCTCVYAVYQNHLLYTIYMCIYMTKDTDICVYVHVYMCVYTQTHIYDRTLARK